MSLRLADADKITIVLRIEPSCLGPDGRSHIDTFCLAAAAVFEAFEPDLINWVLLPRHDKQLPEQSFFIAGRTLSERQARLLLRRVARDPDALQERVDSLVVGLIERYLNMR